MLGGGIDVINTPERFHANLPKASTKAKQSKNTLKMDVFKHSIPIVLFITKTSTKSKRIPSSSKVYTKKRLGIL